MTHIAFLGTGLLGAALAEAAALRGDTVTAWNRTPDKAQALSQFGIAAASSPADAVRNAQRIHLVLKDDAVVDAVLAAAREGMRPDAIILDHSTTLPALTAERAARLHAQGVHYLHCPVFMGPAAARSAKGSILAAGPQGLFDQVRDALARMTGRLEYLGERTDLAAVNKLFGNAMIIGVSALMADILTIARASDVPAPDAVALFRLLDINTTIGALAGTMAKGNFTPTFELAMARKDVRLMLDAAGERPMAVLPAVAARMDQLIAAGHGGLGTSVMGIDAVS